MGYEKYWKGSVIMPSYYHRTHKNYNPDNIERGQLNSYDCPLGLFAISNTEHEIAWVYSAEVTNESLIGYHQVVYVLSRLICIYSNAKMKEWLDKDKTFNSLLQKDSLGRKYLTYKDYKNWVIKNKRIKLTHRQRRELSLWILGL